MVDHILSAFSLPYIFFLQFSFISNPDDCCHSLCTSLYKNLYSWIYSTPAISLITSEQRPSGRLTKLTKTDNPRTEPCGTPRVTLLRSETVPITEFSFPFSPSGRIPSYVWLQLDSSAGQYRKLSGGPDTDVLPTVSFLQIIHNFL